MEKSRRTMEIDGLQNAANYIMLILKEENQKRNRLISAKHIEYGEKKENKLLMEFERETDSIKSVNNFVVQKSWKKNLGKKPGELAKTIEESSGKKYIGYVESSNKKYFFMFFA